MSRYIRVAGIILIIELACVIMCNVMMTVHKGGSFDRAYRIETERAARELNNGKDAQDIDLSGYKTIVGITPFSAGDVCNNDYVVKEANGKLYRIEYCNSGDNKFFWYMNAGMGIMFLISAFVLFYIWKKVIMPFRRMEEVTCELAKGNLAVPVREEKSKYFGSFMWGIDMLRESMEADKQKGLELQKEKKTLILSLSHDIKTPLSAIELYSRALDGDLYGTEEERRSALRGILNNVNDIKRYVDEIATASREDFINLKVREEEFYLSQIMHSVNKYYKDKLSVLHTEFIVDNMDDCLLSGDMDRITETLQNIMENAVKYGDGKRVRISCAEEEECRLITVENTGCSLKEEELPHIFDSFYRGSNSKGISGSGLGLYIARNLMRKMGGDIFACIKGQEFGVTVVIRKA